MANSNATEISATQNRVVMIPFQPNSFSEVAPNVVRSDRRWSAITNWFEVVNSLNENLHVTENQFLDFVQTELQTRSSLESDRGILFLLGKFTTAQLTSVMHKFVREYQYSTAA